MSELVLQHTQRHVIGMNVQQGSWKKLKQQLPCSSCLAGKMRKLNKAGAKDYTDLDNLALSWTPNTAEKKVRLNEEVSIDWGIINKQAIPNQNNVFALFLDLNTGLPGSLCLPVSKSRASWHSSACLYTTIWSTTNSQTRHCARILSEILCL